MGGRQVVGGSKGRCKGGVGQGQGPHLVVVSIKGIDSLCRWGSRQEGVLCKHKIEAHRPTIPQTKQAQTCSLMRPSEEPPLTPTSHPSQPTFPPTSPSGPTHPTGARSTA